MIKSTQHATPSGIAGPGGGYFHKQYGTKNTTIAPSIEAAAVINLAHFANDQDDFRNLIDILGLNKAVDQLRKDRRHN